MEVTVDNKTSIEPIGAAEVSASNSTDVVVADNTALDITVTKKEYKIVGDEVYIAKLYEDAPQWMKDLVQLVVDNTMANESTALLNSLVSQLNQFAVNYVPLNTYTQSILDLSNADTSMHNILETLNSHFNDGLNTANSQIIDLQTTKASKTEVATKVIETLTAQLATPTSELGATIANLQQTIVDGDSANADSVTTLMSVLEGEVDARATAVNTLNTYVGIDSSGTATGGGLLNSVQELQNQIDGNITTWFYDGVPTLLTTPASGWATAEEKANHVGDIYYDKTSGYGYRFAYEDIVDVPDAGVIYSWIRIVDTDVVKALADAATAQETADGKVVTFYQTTAPTAEGVGDLWIDSDDGNKMYRWNGSSWGTDLVGTMVASSSAVTNLAVELGNVSTTLSDTAAIVAGQFALWDGFSVPMLGNIKFVDTAQYQYLGSFLGELADGWVRTDESSQITAAEAKRVADTAYGWAATASSFITDTTSGLITGWAYSDSSSTPSTFTISSEKFSLVDPLATSKVLYENGVFRTYDDVGNYSQLSGGGLEFYKASTTTAYKYLKFVQSGTVANGAVVTLTGFDKVPSVIVSPADLTVFDHTKVDQSQALKCYPAELVISGGVVTFRPTAQLVLAGTTNVEALSWNYTSSVDVITTDTATTPANTTNIQVLIAINSSKSTGTAGTYYNRTSSSQLQVFTGGAWVNTGVAQTINHTDLTADSVTVVSGTLTPNSYVYRIVVTYTNTGGTFSTGTVWDYYTTTVTSSAATAVSSYSFDGVYNASLVSKVTLSYALQAGEELVSSSYSVAMDITDYSQTDGASAVSAYALQGASAVFNKSYYGPSYDVDLVGTGFTVFNYPTLNKLTASTYVVAESNLGGHQNSLASIYTSVKDRVLTLNLRKPSSTSTASSNYLNNSIATYVLSTETQLAAGSVNYIAIG